MNILITHAYSTDNNGDEAILRSQIDTLLRLKPDAKITILTANQHLKSAKGPGKTSELHSLFFFAFYYSKNPITRTMNTLLILITTLMWGLVFHLFRINALWIAPKAIRPTLTAYLKSNIIITVGGGYINGRNSLTSTLTLIIQLHSIFIAYLLRKPIVLYSQSIGPLSNWFQRKITSFTLKKANIIFARENITSTTLAKIGIPQHLIHRSADAAFELHLPVNSQKKSFHIPKIENKLTIGITVRKWLTKDKQEQFLSELAKFIDILTEKHNAHILLIPQVTSDYHNDDDRVQQRIIMHYVHNTSGVTNITQKCDLNTLLSIYSQLDYLVGTRMHSVILSLIHHIPCIAIQYEPKTLGIMMDMKQERYVVNIEDVTAQALEKTFNSLIKNRRGYIKNLCQGLKKYKKISQENNKLLTKLLDQVHPISI